MPRSPKPGPSPHSPSAPAKAAPPAPPQAAARPRLSPAQQKLVQDHIPFVRSIARRLREQVPAIEFDDLVGFGMTGLLEAAQRYDDRHGAVFTTFAYYRVRGAIFDGIRTMGWLPRGEYARLRFEERASAYLENLSARLQGAQSTPGAEGERSVEDEVRELAEALSGVATVFVTLLTAPQEETLVDDRPPVHEQLEQHQMAQRVRRALSRLPDKERRLIQSYYFEDQTLEQVGASLGLSKSWTSRLHARAVALLRDQLIADGWAGPTP